jgi:hypothetical protein
VERWTRIINNYSKTNKKEVLLQKEQSNAADMLSI